MSNALVELTSKLATTLNMGANGAELFHVLKATAFKGNATDAQMTALLVVANQYGLNPFTKELYAFPDKNNGIVPVVGVDGWSRIINGNPLFDGMDFKQDDESCTCIIYRKDRSHPVSTTEFMSECNRKQGPWLSHPKRMLRHKAMIQCARLAFGFAGIYDHDEAERIVSPDTSPVSVDLSAIESANTMQELQDAFVTAWKASPDAKVREILTDAKDKRKKAIAAMPLDVNPETGEVIALEVNGG